MVFIKKEVFTLNRDFKLDTEFPVLNSSLYQTVSGRKILRKQRCICISIFSVHLWNFAQVVDFSQCQLQFLLRL